MSVCLSAFSFLEQIACGGGGGGVHLISHTHPLGGVDVPMGIMTF